MYLHYYASMKIDIGQMHASAAEAEELLKAMANRHRLMILCQLIDGERSVGELAEFLTLRDANVSQHLALLRKDGLVSTRREGQTIWYAIASEPARRLVETLYQAFCAPARICTPKPPKGKLGR
jgi:ArsR family transcriptional regulator, virulence genes transcriptional regulator